jgi:DNA processing protein
MRIFQETAYWMTVAHLPRWTTARINQLSVDMLSQRQLSFTQFFASPPADWQQAFSLSPKEVSDLEQAQKELPNYAALADTLTSQDIEILPITSETYSQTLKKNLDLKYAPPVLYVKGNTQLLNEPSVAIVGSRNASERALQFTKTIAQRCTKNYEVIVSGFAKGVDQTALDAALEAHGHSIIVLPQGILTFGSGFRKYQADIAVGNLLVLSAYPPQAPWSVGLAMGRNVYIYGLAAKIYVAESDSQGGTWTGVMDGLRKRRTIYVRQPEPDEKNANALLIEQGAVPVDIRGEPLEIARKPQQGELF